MIEEMLETPKISQDPEEALAVLLAMATELRSLLSIKEVFRPVLVECPNKRRQMLMSCGGLLARLHRLQHQRKQLTPEQILVLETAQGEVDETIHTYRQLFENVLHDEAQSRLNDLDRFLVECEADHEYMIDEFPVEMRNRQRLEEVIQALGKNVDVQFAERLEKLDNWMRALCHPSSFIWDAELRYIYPVDRYWYLYIEPKN